MEEPIEGAAQVEAGEKWARASGGAQTRGYLIALVQEAQRIRAFGSSADKSDCDEILEINGKSVGQTDEEQHCDIVRHIQENLLKITSKMEMLELGNANQQAAADNDGPFDMMNGQNQLQSDHQLPVNQMNINAAHLYRNHHHQQQLQRQQQQQHQMRLVNNQKVSKHRELPVDVPDSFVGIAKQSPRYPPPKPHRQISPSVPTNNLTTFTHPSTTQAFNNSNNNSNSQHHQPLAPPIAQSTAANIVTHNASLRSSIKLKQLEKSRVGQHHGGYPVGQMQPAVNQAFEMNEDESMSAVNHQGHLIKQQQQNIFQVKQSMPDLCSIYNRLQRNLDGEFANATDDAKLAKLLSIYNTIVQTHDKQYRLPNLTSRIATKINSQGNHEHITYKVSDLLNSVIYLLREEEMTSDAVELLAILGNHEIDGVCSAFDRISQSFEFIKAPTSSNESDLRDQPPPSQWQHQDREIYPYQQLSYDCNTGQVQMDIENNIFQPLTDIDLSDGTCTKTVQIEKNANQPLGATIKNEDGSVVIGRLICGGAAHNSGLFNEGDEILEVNGVNLRGKNVNDVINILQGIQNKITFTIISRNLKPAQRRSREKVFVRAFFSYDGESDRYIPCKELGLSFERGEVLAIIDQSDPKWWQAHRERDSEYRLAGLIPSITFLKEREKESAHEDSANAYLKREKKNLVSLLFNCPKGSPRQRKKLSSNLFTPAEINYYEEVTTYYSTMYCKRPIILVGPKMIGQREISNRLLKDSSRFAAPKSHTSKPMTPDDRDGEVFHFVTRTQFEEDSKDGKFIECGLYQNHYYGTSLDAMKEVVRSKKTCVFLMNTSSFFNFRHGRAGAELKPFFVFVKPDDSHQEKLRNNVASFSPPKSNIEERIREITAEVELIETHYLPYFDFVLTISDIDRAYQELLHEIDKVEGEPKWIPKFWLETPAPN